MYVSTCSLGYSGYTLRSAPLLGPFQLHLLSQATIHEALAFDVSAYLSEEGGAWGPRTLRSPGGKYSPELLERSVHCTVRLAQAVKGPGQLRSAQKLLVGG